MTAPIRDTDTPSAAERLEILKAGWRAMAMLERHAQERSGIPALDAHACAPCMRYGVAVGLRGEKPSEVLHLRCEAAQDWQRQIEAANRLVFSGEDRP